MVASERPGLERERFSRSSKSFVKTIGFKLKITKRQLKRIILEMYHDDQPDSISQRLKLRNDIGELSMSFVRTGLDRDEVAGILRDVAER